MTRIFWRALFWQQFLNQNLFSWKIFEKSLKWTFFDNNLCFTTIFRWTFLTNLTNFVMSTYLMITLWQQFFHFFKENFVDVDCIHGRSSFYRVLLLLSEVYKNFSEHGLGCLGYSSQESHQHPLHHLLFHHRCHYHDNHQNQTFKLV